MEINIEHLAGTRSMIVPMDESHLDGLFEAGKSEKIWAYMPMHISQIEHMHLLIKHALEAKKQGTEFPFVIIDQTNGEIVGSTRFLDITDAHRNLEIGWTWLSPAVHRTSINTECKYLLLQYCFETLQLLRVQIKTDLRNTQSQNAIERIGGVKEGILRRHRILPDGYIRDTVYYSILDTEWPAVKKNLIGMLSKTY